MMAGVLVGSPRAVLSWTTPARDGTSRSRWWSNAALESISAATSEAAWRSSFLLGRTSALARSGAQPWSMSAALRTVYSMVSATSWRDRSAFRRLSAKSATEPSRHVGARPKRCTGAKAMVASARAFLVA